MQTNARFHLGWVAALPEKPNTDDRLRRQRKVVSGLFLKAVSVSAVLTYQRLRSHRILKKKRIPISRTDFPLRLTETLDSGAHS